MENKEQRIQELEQQIQELEKYVSDLRNLDNKIEYRIKVAILADLIQHQGNLKNGQ